MVTIEMIYMPGSNEPFIQVRQSLTEDAQAIGAHITDISNDSSQFSLESGDGNGAITHHHMLFKHQNFVFDVNFFNNFNSEDLADIKKMMDSLVLHEAKMQTQGISSGQRIPVGLIQVDKQFS